MQISDFYKEIQFKKRVVAMAGSSFFRCVNKVLSLLAVMLVLCLPAVTYAQADKVTTYKSTGFPSFKINHKGAVNVRAVLSWIYANFSQPEKIFVTGCSAGSYGSLMWAAHLAKHYPQSKIYQLGDSGAGVITKSFLKDSFSQWNATPAV